MKFDCGEPRIFGPEPEDERDNSSAPENQKPKIFEEEEQDREPRQVKEEKKETFSVAEAKINAEFELQCRKLEQWKSGVEGELGKSFEDLAQGGWPKYKHLLDLYREQMEKIKQEHERKLCALKKGPLS